MPAVLDPEQEKQNKLNPSAHNSQKIFDEPFIGPGDSDRAEVVRRLAERDRRAAENERPEAGVEGAKKAESEPTGNNQLLGDIPFLGGGGKNLANRAIKRWAIGIGVSTISAVIAALGVGAVSFFVNLKEMSLNFFTKNEYSAYSTRIKSLQDRIFNVPGQNCKLSIRCRLAPGISDKDIQKYKDAGFEVETDTTDSGKTYVKKLTTQVDDKVIELDQSNFKKIYDGASLESLVVKGRLWSTGSKPQALAWRATNALLKFAQFRIDRSFIGDTIGKVREYIFGGGTGKSLLADPETNGDQTQNDAISKDVGSINGNIQTAADAEKARAITEGPSFEVDPGALNGPQDLAPEAAKVAASTAKDTIKGALEGVLSAVDYACTGYSLIRDVTLGAKLYKYAGLILFAISFMTQADSLKAGQATPSNIALYAGSLVRPSTLPGSLGKTAANSNLFSLVTDNKVQNVSGLSYGVMGFAALGWLQAAEKTFEGLGANANNCKQVLSWYGQAFIIGTGIISAIFTEGGTSAGGIAISVTLGLVVSSVVSFVTPMLIKYLAGTVAPDLLGPGGGFAIGDAIAGGLGGFSAELGKAGGLRPINTGEAQKVFNETNTTMAQINTIDQMGKSPFSLDSPNSVTSRLAMAVFPYVSAPTSAPNLESLASLATAPFSLIGDAVNQLFTQRVGALSTSAGGEYCADTDLIQMNVETDAYCNPLYGEENATIDAPQYQPDKVMDYMINNNYVNEVDGTPAASDNGKLYQKFLDSCVFGTEPLTPDGAPVDISSGGDTDTRLCPKQDEQETMFRFFVMDQNILNGMDASSNGTLGQNTSPAAATGTSTSSTNNGTTVTTINGVKYVFPVGGLSKANIRSNNCAFPLAHTCHEDNTVAFDLSDSSTSSIDNTSADDATVGKPVYAISDGTIQFIDPAYQGIAGCNTVQFDSVDGYHYWYGHVVVDSKFAAGQKVTAGTALGTIGPRKCTGNGSYPHLHIDRGSPQGSDGGYVCCRDTGFLTTINQIWAGLPN